MNIRYYYKLGTVSVKEVESKSAMGSAMGSEIADKRTSSSLSLGFQIFNCPQRTTQIIKKCQKLFIRLSQPILKKTESPKPYRRGPRGGVGDAKPYLTHIKWSILCHAKIQIFQYGIRLKNI